MASFVIKTHNRLCNILHFRRENRKSWWLCFISHELIPNSLSRHKVSRKKCYVLSGNYVQTEFLCVSIQPWKILKVTVSGRFWWIPHNRKYHLPPGFLWRNLQWPAWGLSAKGHRYYSYRGAVKFVHRNAASTKLWGSNPPLYKLWANSSKFRVRLLPSLACPALDGSRCAWQWSFCNWLLLFVVPFSGNSLTPLRTGVSHDSRDSRPSSLSHCYRGFKIVPVCHGGVCL